jgi:hypothetical protein
MKLLEDKLLPGDNWVAKDALKNSIFPVKIRVGVPARRKWEEAGFWYSKVICTFIVIDFFVAALAFFGSFHCVK